MWNGLAVKRAFTLWPVGAVRPYFRPLFADLRGWP
jgi:hypothetical protein